MMRPLLINHATANGSNLLSDSIINPMDSAYCCMRCHQEIRRLEFHVLGKVLRPLPVCHCVKEEYEQLEEQRKLRERRSRLLHRYGEGIMDDELRGCSFLNFEVSHELETAYRYAQHFTKNFRQQQTGLYLYGTVGVGKSHLVAAIHNELQAQGYPSLFIDVTRLFGLMKSTFKGNSGKTDQDYIRSAIQCELLTLDEMGLSSLSEYEFSILFQILNGRKGKPTNFTSNLDLTELEIWLSRDRYGRVLDSHGRLFDRLLMNTDAIQINAESYRKKMALERMRLHRGT